MCNINIVFYISDTWYCSVRCRDDVNDIEDQVLQYSRKLMWDAPLQMTRNDIVREGDRMALISMWKIHMLSFWNRRHCHYRLIGHHLLACKKIYIKKYFLCNT